MKTTGIKINNLKKTFFTLRGKVEALKKVDLDIKPKEFFVLLGPSGCGKSTLLNLIAGLDKASDGEISFGEKVVVSTQKRIFLEPFERDLAFVFQNYALYPHMTVEKNINFPLTNSKKKIRKQEIIDKVKKTAKLLKIENLLNRKPKELSGGQKQRVAIGRAIIREPQIFLMDEPLSNLDAQLRIDMRAQLKLLQQSLGVTTIYVTHDQLEAMTLGDRIAVLNNGIIQQIGTPTNIYNKPANVFIAKFLGSPSMNIIEGEIKKENKKLILKTFICDFVLSNNSLFRKLNLDVTKIILGIRPEHIKTLQKGKGDFDAKIGVVENIGSEYLIYYFFNDTQIVVKSVNSPKKKDVSLKFSIDRIHIFDENGERIN